MFNISGRTLKDEGKCLKRKLVALLLLFTGLNSSLVRVSVLH